MFFHSHVTEVCSAECSLHSEAVCDAHLAPHHHARSGLLALAHSELTAVERELVGSLGRKRKGLLR